MDELKAIWRLVNATLEDREFWLDYYKKENENLKADYESLMQENVCLTSEIERLNGIIAELKGEAE
jgi:regulator of replication initiation timing